MEKKPILTSISRGTILEPGTVHLKEGGGQYTVWPWTRDPKGDKALVDYIELHDAIFFADQCERALQRESESAGKVLLWDKAKDIVSKQADNDSLWFGDNINQVRAALRQLHMLIEGGLSNPLMDILSGKIQK